MATCGSGIHHSRSAIHRVMSHRPAALVLGCSLWTAGLPTGTGRWSVNDMAVKGDLQATREGVEISVRALQRGCCSGRHSSEHRTAARDIDIVERGSLLSRQKPGWQDGRAGLPRRLESVAEAASSSALKSGGKVRVAGFVMRRIRGPALPEKSAVAAPSTLMPCFFALETRAYLSPRAWSSFSRAGPQRVPTRR